MKKPPEKVPLNASSAYALHTYLRETGSLLSPHEAASAAVGPRLFFAPVVGAVRGVRQALRRIERENSRHDAEVRRTGRH